MSEHGYRYVGNGERYKGVPPRDISQAFFDALSPLDQRTVLTSGAYEPIEGTDDLADMKLDELKRRAIEAGADEDAVGAMRSKADVIAAIKAAQAGQQEGSED